MLTHFIVGADVPRSATFYSDVLGGEVVLEVEPSIVALADAWVIIVTGGGLTEDKPEVVLGPRDPNRVSAFLHIRVADIQGRYEDLEGRRAPDPGATARDGDPLLPPGPRRPPDRGGPADRSALRRSR